MKKVQTDFYNTNLSYRERLGFENYSEGLDTSGEELITQQHAKDECDINNIVARYGERELYNHAQTVQMAFQDLSEIPSYQEALNIIRQADEGFMELPAKVRARFNNDPGQLITFLEDKNNDAEALSLGLIEKSPEGQKANPPSSPPQGQNPPHSNAPPSQPTP